MTFFTLNIVTLITIIAINAFTVMDGEYLFRVSRCQRCNMLDTGIITWSDRIRVWVKDSNTAIGLLLFITATGMLSILIYLYILILFTFSIMRTLDGQQAATLSLNYYYKLFIGPFTVVWLLPCILYFS